MKNIMYFIFLVFATQVPYAQDSLKFPDYPIEEIQEGTLHLLNSTVINAISVAKESGMTVEEFASKMADRWQVG